MINDMLKLCSLLTAHYSKTISFSLIHIEKKRIFVVFSNTFLLCLNAREKGGGIFISYLKE